MFEAPTSADLARSAAWDAQDKTKALERRVKSLEELHVQDVTMLTELARRVLLLELELSLIRDRQP